MSNQISIEDFRNNYDEYQKRMDAGEVFTFIDFDEKKKDLMKPVGSRGLPVTVYDMKI